MSPRKLIIALAVTMSCAAVGPAVGAASTSAAQPVLAYYYIWFDHSSWRRAKTDYPQLGRYSSDNVAVLRQHVRWAKQAGIDGFIVSWKSTPTLNRRLAKLVRVARQERFKLAIIYQGLDFEREPLPAARVAHDLQFFARRFATNRVFRIFERPLVVWSGTWRFSGTDIERVTAPLRRELLILASERSKQGYERVAKSVDGDAYYWSSVDPSTYPGYAEKLEQMGDAVHSNDGLWIAPAAPGFDARLIGGKTVVPRLGGDTLQQEFNVALQSSPDAVGVISWNEFSENSHIEPSIRYGREYLGVLSDVGPVRYSDRSDFDSSSSRGGIGYGLPVLSGLFGLIFSALLVSFMRRHITHVHATPTKEGEAKQ